MIKNFINNFRGKSRGFSLLELLLSLAVFSIILLAVYSFFFSLSDSNLRTKASQTATDNAKRALEVITFEIKSAKSIYTPTTTASQLSLETSRYLQSGETATFIDFFMCGYAVCMKKESQEDAVALTSDSVQVTNLVFSQISTGTNPSVKVGLTVTSGSGQNLSSVNLTSTASVRSY